MRYLEEIESLADDMASALKALRLYFMEIAEQHPDMDTSALSDLMAEDDLITVLVIKHSTSRMSVEGAIHQRNEADKAIAALGLEVVAATTGRGDAAAEGMRIMKLTWGVEDA